MLSFIIDLVVVYWFSEAYRHGIDCSLHKTVIRTVKFTIVSLIITSPMTKPLQYRYFDICNVIEHWICGTTVIGMDHQILKIVVNWQVNWVNGIINDMIQMQLELIGLQEHFLS